MRSYVAYHQRVNHYVVSDLGPGVFHETQLDIYRTGVVEIWQPLHQKHSNSNVMCVCLCWDSLFAKHVFQGGAGGLLAMQAAEFPLVHGWSD